MWPIGQEPISCFSRVRQLDVQQVGYNSWKCQYVTGSYLYVVVQLSADYQAGRHPVSDSKFYLLSNTFSLLKLFSLIVRNEY